MVRLVIVYLIIINAFGFLIMGLDKSKSKRESWRIPEKTLLLVAILGGSVGSYFGMQVFHHKTLHKRFAIGIPMIILVQIIIVVVLKKYKLI